MEKKELPKGWEMKKLGEVLIPINKGYKKNI
jgi:hypothetical protein